MNVIDALKRFGDVRLTNGDKWLVWNMVGGDWTVYFRPKFSKSTKILITTPDIEAAIEVLMREEK